MNRVRVHSKSDRCLVSLIVCLIFEASKGKRIYLPLTDGRNGVLLSPKVRQIYNHTTIEDTQKQWTHRGEPSSTTMSQEADPLDTHPYHADFNWTPPTPTHPQHAKANGHTRPQPLAADARLNSALPSPFVSAPVRIEFKSALSIVSGKSKLVSFGSILTWI